MTTNGTLAKLFNIVVNTDNAEPSRVVLSTCGVILNASLSAQQHAKVRAQLEKDYQSMYGLRKSFYDTWQTLLGKTEAERLLDQVVHYMSTYGTNFDEDMTYVPNIEFYADPSVAMQKAVQDAVKFRIVRGVSRKEALTTVTEYINTGIALDDTTSTELLEVLRDLDYDFSVPLRNKELTIKIADESGVMPNDATEFLRYVCFRATGKALLIKNKQTINAIEGISDLDLQDMLLDYVNRNGYKPLAEVFNRFKPLFLAMKNACTRTIINKVARLSKSQHKPMPVNPLNSIVSEAITDQNEHWLKNATTWHILRAMNALTLATAGPTAKVYKIRNGRSWVDAEFTQKCEVNMDNYDRLLNELKSRVGEKSGTVYIPSDVNYACPTSEKSFMGNIPERTTFSNDYALIVGCYWHNDGGARDIDISCIDISGNKTGWNTHWRNNSVYYSGDVTNASNGAVEYLRFESTANPQAVMLNVYSGNSESDYTIIVGKGDRVDADEMMEGDNVYARANKTTLNSQSILGFTTVKDDVVSFTVMNTNDGNNSVAGYSELLAPRIQAAQFENEHRLKLVDILTELGYTVTHDVDVEADFDLTPEKLAKDTIINLLK